MQPPKQITLISSLQQACLQHKAAWLSVLELLLSVLDLAPVILVGSKNSTSTLPALPETFRVLGSF